MLSKKREAVHFQRGLFVNRTLRLLMLQLASPTHPHDRQVGEIFGHAPNELDARVDELGAYLGGTHAGTDTGSLHASGLVAHRAQAGRGGDCLSLFSRIFLTLGG